jgi:WD40 repeat protein
VLPWLPDCINSNNLACVSNSCYDAFQKQAPPGRNILPSTCAVATSNQLSSYQQPSSCPVGVILSVEHSIHRHERHTTLKGHVDDVLCLLFSSDGKCLASGSHDESVRVWLRRTHHDATVCYELQVCPRILL